MSENENVITIDDVMQEAFAQHNSQLGKQITQEEANSLIKTGLVSIARYLLIVKNAADSEELEEQFDTVEELCQELIERVHQVEVVQPSGGDRDSN